MAKGEYESLGVSTIGIDIIPVDVPVHGVKSPVKISFYDTAGQERYRALAKPYIRGSDAVLLTFCADSPLTRSWYSEIEKDLPENAELFLVCTKIDLDAEGKVTAGVKTIPEHWHVPEDIGEKVGYVIYNVSSKEGWGIDNLKNDIARKCWEKDNVIKQILLK
uniref:Uncharacterized protein n=1 Tax=Arcella intermedia TaxID=1963864 RepID=A0A6B2LJX2_9EUKA